MANTMLYLGKKVEVIRNAMIGDDQFNPNAPSLFIRDPETGAQFSVAKTSLVPVQEAPTPTMPRRPGDVAGERPVTTAPAAPVGVAPAVVIPRETVTTQPAPGSKPQQATTPPKPTIPHSTVGGTQRR